MRIVMALGLVLAAACGGKHAAPATTPAADNKPSPADKPGGGGSQCCCELPADPPVYEMHDSTECHEDSHGVCQADETKCKK